MEIDPVHVSTLESKLASSEKTVATLQEELARKNEEYARMEAQIITLSENIASKDHIIYDLEQNLKILQQSVDELAKSGQDNTEAKKMVDFYKKELELREQEAARLTRERDMLNWKLIYEALPAENEVVQERNSLRVKNESLSYENSGLSCKLDNLSKKIDILSKRNADLTAELEKRSKFTVKLKSDFENAIQSRNKIRAEFETLKTKLTLLQSGMKCSSATNSKFPARTRSSEKPSIPFRRPATQQSVRSQRVGMSSKENSVVKACTNPSTLEMIEETPRSESSIFQDVKNNIVRKIVNDIQSSLSTEPIACSNSKSLAADLQQEDNSPPVRDTADDIARKLAFESIRDILENKCSFDSTNQTTQTDLSFKKSRSIHNSTPFSTKDLKNHRL